ncbi:MAG: Transcriptional regulatory protein YycF [Candidatus Omnitrophica bacterium ADurb.Bin292]|nr:MAG: Transcriptional regulatory protein YycF [Candidatus Omnitrophica bacterium ADurb.Bin292]HOE68685.1 response regulator [Candidatus Omnitrophota bacterium]HQB94037.1 response regulator [Candidatus Omnitrophota bacterium]
MSKQILVIDDEELITKSLVLALERNGYEVLVAKHCDEAVAMAESIDFDLIISDIRMPGPDGIETVTRVLDVMTRRGIKQAPRIFMTGYADPKAEAGAQALSPTAYILKPFDLVVFLAEVKKVLGD